jgi:hypothetical protein
MPFSQSRNIYRPNFDPQAKVHLTLPPGVYTVRQSMFGFYLEDTGPMKQPTKLYGKTLAQANRILNTFEDRQYNTGVLLSGQKGSGKTLLARTIGTIGAAERHLPTLIVDTQYDLAPFADFLREINQPAIILFDEFEKIYDAEHQQEMLTVLDGVFPSKKLVILTCNDQSRVDEHMINRPGRIFYALKFAGVDPDFVKEYCVDNLKDQQQVDSVVMVAAMSENFSFDALQALVEEMNRYNETPADAVDMLNIEPEGNMSFDVEIVHFGVKIPLVAVHPEQTDQNPFADPELRVQYNVISAYRDVLSGYSKNANPDAERILAKIVNENGHDAAQLKKGFTNKQRDGVEEYGLEDTVSSAWHDDESTAKSDYAVAWSLQASDVIARDPIKGTVVYQPNPNVRVTLTRYNPKKWSYKSAL